MPSTVWYSCSPFETGDIKTGSPTITISGGVATLSVAQTGNIGCGDCIEYASTAVYIAPNRLGFDSGGTTEVKVGDKIQGATSGATGIIRAVELISGSWSGGDAAGYFYFEQTTGTWQDNETINRIRPSNASNVATVNGTLQGNIGNGNTQFVVKTAMGCTPVDHSSTSVTSIHHEYASLKDLEAGFTDANHLNSTDLTASGADVIVHACCYYDHSDYTGDTDRVTIDIGTTDATHYFFIFTPMGGSESINKQRHDGKWDNTAYRFEFTSYTDYTNFIQVKEDYTKIDGIQAKLTYGHDEQILVIVNNLTSGDNLVELSNIILWGASTADNVKAQGLARGSSGIIVNVWNCIAYGFKDTNNAKGLGFNLTSNSGTNRVRLYNCTAVGNYYGIYDGEYEGVLVKNCLSYNNTDNYNGSFISGCTNNLSGPTQTDAPGSNARNGVTVAFVDDSNHDYHLASTDTGAKDYGYDLSTDPYLPIWRDIDGEDRVGGTWDIGADEYVAVGEVPMAVKMSYYLRQMGA